MAGKHRYLRGVIVFFVISIGTLLMMYFFGDYETLDQDLMRNLGEISLWFFLLAVAFYFINVLTDSYLVRTLLHAVDDDMPFMQCIYSVLGNEFLTAITPFQSGGQPLMVYVMHKNNVSLGKGILIVFFKTAAQIYFFAIAAPIVLLIWPEFAQIPELTAFYIYGMLFFTYFLSLTFLVLVKPHFAKKISVSVFRFLGKFRYFRKRKAKMARSLRKTIREVNIFSHFTKNILKTRKV
ncbi:MAG: flippase-like domain-containing protein, partial [Spirochaetota bacterium]|nr:flippase-like domain-containing protein [Spirochaetota bacterium]